MAPGPQPSAHGSVSLRVCLGGRGGLSLSFFYCFFLFFVPQEASPGCRVSRGVSRHCVCPRARGRDGEGAARPAGAERGAARPPGRPRGRRNAEPAPTGSQGSLQSRHKPAGAERFADPALPGSSRDISLRCSCPKRAPNVQTAAGWGHRALEGGGTPLPPGAPVRAFASYGLHPGEALSATHTRYGLE